MKALVIMGVSGSGKSTIGRLLAEKTGKVFLDGDDFHPPENVRKMKSGEPLNDDDRRGWLEHLARVIEESERSPVVACSALKESYREALQGSAFVFLDGSPELLAERMGQRSHHFMPATLLASQLETLERPMDALVLDIKESPDELVKQIRKHLGW